jgi:hypothetical protein
MEIREVLPPNSGRDAPPTFLARKKLPKDFEGLRLPGENAPRTVLNVFGQLNKQRYILDNLKVNLLEACQSLPSMAIVLDRCARPEVLHRPGLSHWSTRECLWSKSSPDRL